MKKLVVQFSLILSLLTISLSSKSQAFVGSHINYNQYLALGGGGLGFGYLGMALTAEFPLGANGVRPSFNFGIPARIERTYDLNSISTGMYDTTINGFERYNFFNLYVDFKYFLGDGDTEFGGLYFFGGGGLTIASIVHRLDDYDEDIYEPTFDVTGKDRVYQPVIRGGGGYEHSFEFGNIYAEVFANVPANQLFNVTFSINMPLMIGFQAGIKIPVGY